MIFSFNRLDDKLEEVIKTQIKHNLDINFMVIVLHRDNYGDKISIEVLDNKNSYNLGSYISKLKKLLYLRPSMMMLNFKLPNKR